MPVIGSALQTMSAKLILILLLLDIEPIFDQISIYYPTG